MLKTPGVYIEEISKFPPSVAQVETAIPAFVGYTEKALEKGKSLTNNPTRITSMLDYETLFGFAKAETSIAVSINDSEVNGALQRDIVVSQPSTPSPFLMYYALQMYFANGGGPCYIVSVNNYDADGTDIVDFTALADGLELLKKEDEPTLLVFPDAKALNEVDFYSLYQNALLQCNDLQDRFTIIDTHTSDDVEDNSETLRNRISLGKDYLKYGAAYYPYLDTILDYRYTETSVDITHVSDDSQALADELQATEDALEAITTLQSDSLGLITAYNDANTALQAMTAGDALTNKNSVIDPLQDIVDALTEVVSQAAVAVTAGNDAATAADEDVPTATAATNAATALNEATTTPAEAFPTLIATLEGHITSITDAANGTDTKNAAAAAVADAGTTTTAMQPIIDLIDPTLLDAINAAQAVDTNGALDGLTLDQVEAVDNAAYNAIKTAINAMPITLPPSSTVAGIYARVDSDRGVWKAPANVGVNYVMKPVLKVTHDQQKDLNVHTTGKSINAIRSFTGKGILVWGARTLAGNDNEWRYVPVRRFFNMVEESVEKATEQFVFEPNDANTWVKVRAMIENFLTLQWRAGALAGAKPKEAFYVRVGLGETMTAEDILNGVMNIEIGMAAVRPAEFIVLKFSHKMQES